MKHILLLQNGWVYGGRPISASDAAAQIAGATKAAELGLATEVVAFIDLPGPNAPSDHVGPKVLEDCLGRVFDRLTETFSEPCPRPTGATP